MNSKALYRQQFHINSDLWWIRYGYIFSTTVFKRILVIEKEEKKYAFIWRENVICSFLWRKWKKNKKTFSKKTKLAKFILSQLTFWTPSNQYMIVSMKCMLSHGSNVYNFNALSQKWMNNYIRRSDVAYWKVGLAQLWCFYMLFSFFWYLDELFIILLYFLSAITLFPLRFSYMVDGRMNLDF